MSTETNVYLLQLITSLSVACMQQLGKIISPITGKIERDLEQAKYSIELLRMLREKTEGNLSTDELRILDHAIYEAQMNYLDEAKKEQVSGNTPADQSPKKAEEEEKKDSI